MSQGGRVIAEGRLAETVKRSAPATIEAQNRIVVACRRCPRLVRYRERVAQEKVARFRGWTYWGRPLPGFGNAEARLLVVGLAPAAHGGNRTGRMFTGDRSGDWLFRALWKAGFANRAASVSRDDGLMLRDAYITATVRCAPPGNRPTPEEFRRCRPYLVGDLGLLPRLQVAVALGAVAWTGLLTAWADAGHAVPRPRPRFSHGARVDLGPLVLLASYHPSQRNTQTGLLSEAMFDSVFRTARDLLREDSSEAHR